MADSPTAPRPRHAAWWTGALVTAVLMVGSTGTSRAEGGADGGRPDYLTFAHGAIPLEISGSAASRGVTMEKAIQAVDGDPRGFVLALKSLPPDADTVFLYELPAPTSFDRFAVPDVLETPSPSQTFTRRVEVHGSAVGRDSGFELLASGDLATHRGRGEVTDLAIASRKPVRWVRLRLVGGIDVRGDLTFFEFSEIVGNGTQEAPRMADHFSGAWAARGIQIGLRQRGAAVSGCYDGRGTLQGTVTGNVLRATGMDSGSGVRSAFLLTVAEGKVLRGVRSTNGAPFAPYTAEAADPGGLKCSIPGEPVLGCGSVVHGIAFDYDSAAIRPESGPVLALLYEGLKADPSSRVLIEGHTSSEGGEAYNQALSERRARAVVEDLARRGIAPTRLRAGGAGESRPIAPNTDESGRSMNRRVEVRCGGEG
ncbi:OmpA family protein [Myxococcota bacterium]|nr:OmpA family protein [Myxococcota bacterium]